MLCCAFALEMQLWPHGGLLYPACIGTCDSVSRLFPEVAHQTTYPVCPERSLKLLEWSYKYKHNSPVISPLPPWVHLCHPPILCPSPQYHNSLVFLFFSDQRLQTHRVILNTKSRPPACYKCSLLIARPSCRSRWWNVLLKDVSCVSDWAIFIQLLSHILRGVSSPASFSLAPVLLRKPSLNNTGLSLRSKQSSGLLYDEETDTRIIHLPLTDLWLL